MRPLPTLLGALVLLGGIVTFTRSGAPPLPPPARVALEPLEVVSFEALLIQRTGGEVRTREVTLRTADTDTERFSATLRALRTWLVEETAWPRSLGPPRVFWLGEGRAALEFPLVGTPHVSVSTELWLLASIRQTAARQGVSAPFILVNGRVPPTFLGQVALPGTLE